MNQNKTHIICHIPKTAGTTLRRHLKLLLEDQKSLIHLARRGDIVCKKNKITQYLHRTQAEKNLAQVIIGHDVNFETKFNSTDNKIIESVTVRDPITWEISRYNQHVNRMVMRKNQPITYEYWLKGVNKWHSQFDWLLSNYYCLKQAVSNMSNSLKHELLMSCFNNFDNIVILDRFEAFIKHLLTDLNLNEDLSQLQNQNVVGVDKVNYFERTPLNMELIEKQTEFDYSCYKYIKSNYSKAPFR